MFMRMMPMFSQVVHNYTFDWCLCGSSQQVTTVFNRFKRV